MEDPMFEFLRVYSKVSEKPLWCSSKATCLVNQGLLILSRASLVFRVRLFKNRGPMTIFQDKLLTRTNCAMPSVLSPRDLVFRSVLLDHCKISVCQIYGRKLFEPPHEETYSMYICKKQRRRSAAQ